MRELFQLCSKFADTTTVYEYTKFFMVYYATLPSIKKMIKGKLQRSV